MKLSYSAFCFFNSVIFSSLLFSLLYLSSLSLYCWLLSITDLPFKYNSSFSILSFLSFIFCTSASFSNRIACICSFHSSEYLCFKSENIVLTLSLISSVKFMRLWVISFIIEIDFNAERDIFCRSISWIERLFLSYSSFKLE